MIKYDVSKFSQIYCQRKPWPPPLICWRDTWTEGDLLDDFYDTFQMIKMYFFYYHMKYILGRSSCIQGNEGMIQKEIH